MDNRPKKELARFLAEDLGKGDITSNLLPRKKIKARIVSKQEGIVAGLNYVKDEGRKIKKILDKVTYPEKKPSPLTRN